MKRAAAVLVVVLLWLLLAVWLYRCARVVVGRAVEIERSRSCTDTYCTTPHTDARAHNAQESR